MPFKEPGTDELLRARSTARALRARRRRRARRTRSCSRSARRASRTSRSTWATSARCSTTCCPYLREGQLLVLRSTVAPGTTEFVAGYLEKHRGFKVGEDMFVAHVPERIAADRFLEEIGTLPCIVGGVGEASGERAARAVRGARRADRADDAGPGRAGEDLDQHPALHDVRAAEPADDGLRALRRERVRRHRADQPRLSARRHGAARPHRRHLPAQGLRVLRGEVERAGHAARPSRACTRACRCSSSTASSAGSADLRERKVAVLGLAFKRDTDDERDSLSHKLDPAARARAGGCRASTTRSSPTPTASFEEAVADADVVVVATNHSAYSTPEALRAIVERAGDDCLVVDPWNALRARPGLRLRERGRRARAT